MNPRSGGSAPSALSGGLGWLATVATAVFLGVLLVQIAQAETRWTVFALGAATLALGVALWGLRRALTAYFLLGLTIDAHYYLTQPMPALYTGSTSPGALSIPLALVPGLALLATQRLFDRSTGRRLDWGSEVGRPFAWMFLAAATATALSPLRFVGICVLWQLLALQALFLIVVNTVRTSKEAHRLILLLQIGFVGQCAVFLLQLITGVKFSAVGRVEAVAREGASLLHQATGTAAVTTAGFATFLDPLVLLSYVEFRTREHGRARNLAGCLFGLGVVVVALTLNRSSWLGLPLGLVAAEWLLQKHRLMATSPANMRRLLFGLGSVLLVFLLTFPLFQSVRKAKHSVDAVQRFDLMKPAVNMIRAHPLFGVGTGAYAYRLREYAGGVRGWLYIVHNDDLLIWAERGTVGLLAWAAFILALGRAMNRAARVSDCRMAGFGVASLAGLIVHQWEVFWSSCVSFPAYGIIYVMAGACVVATRLDARAKTNEDDGERSGDGRRDLPLRIAQQPRARPSP